MALDSYNDSRFRQQVDSALKEVANILETSRHPQYPSEVNHQYDDKYLLVEFLSNTSFAAFVQVLELLGVTDKTLNQLLDASQSRSISLRFRSEETCTFVKKIEREVESKTKHVTEIKSIVGTKTITDKVITKVTDYYWNFRVKYELYAFCGVDRSTKIPILSREGQHEIITSTDSSPRSSHTVGTDNEVNISYLFNNINRDLKLKWSINRNTKSCRTPRRNDQVVSAISFFQSIHSWSNDVARYLRDRLFSVQGSSGLDTSKMNTSGVFVPVVPLFEEFQVPSEAHKSSGTLVNFSTEYKGPLLAAGDCNRFLSQQRRSINEKMETFRTIFPDNGKLITFNEGLIILLTLHTAQISQHYVDGVNYVEQMLYRQLLAAVGKELTPLDFADYMKFHNREIFKAEYEPRLFCYAIRRPDHYPEGLISIDAHRTDGTVPDPILSIVRHDIARRPMNFSIDAATRVSFGGDRFLHGWISYQFSGFSGLNLKLTARARQFSSFILMVGTVIGPDQFEPVCATIIQNKDDLKIPLFLETLPTAKEFRDAIESLSPEQQRFARAIRRMQLASSLFGVVVIQIKPQLEKLLKLPYDSLTKEIKLTQDLLELFIKYQIPSDQLSFGGKPDATDEAKLNFVKGQVTAMQNMIKGTKSKELNEQAQSYVYNALDTMPSPVIYRSSFSSAVSAPPAPSGMGGGGYSSRQSSSSAAKPSDADQTPSTEISEYDDPDMAPEEDYTKIPHNLDEKYSKYDVDGQLRPTIIKTSGNWTKKFQKALLAEPEEKTLGTTEQEQERKQAYDLLDALSRSGSLPIDDASLHIVIAATHSFDKTLIDTVIKDNINPIEKVERSTLIMATTLHNKQADELLKPSQCERVSTYSPMLFGLEQKSIEDNNASYKLLEEKAATKQI